jgi:hypothetical protein
VLQHVTRGHSFKDEDLFYRFTAHKNRSQPQARSSRSRTGAALLASRSHRALASSGPAEAEGYTALDEVIATNLRAGIRVRPLLAAVLTCARPMCGTARPASSAPRCTCGPSRARRRSNGW